MRVGPRFFLAALLLTSGCTQLERYRTAYEPCEAPASDRSDYRQAIRVCERSSLEERGDEYLLGFVEFDDQGWFWDRTQMERLIESLEAESEHGDLLMVVFTHGWKHNAHFCNPNVACFREVLGRLAEDERQMANERGRQARKIAGIFVGWRGLSLEGSLANLTFWSRKSTAQRVGSGAVTQLLLELGRLRERIQDRRDESSTRLVVVGHSFGGAVVYSAVAQNLAGSFPRELDGTVEPSPFGDLVVLVNPAFEAARHAPLHELANRSGRTYREDQQPVLGIFTSVGDGATRGFFPVGRWFSTRFRKYREPLQKRADRRTVGHFEPFRTHFLEATGGGGGISDDRSRRKECLCRFQYKKPLAMEMGVTGLTPGRLLAAEVDFPGSKLRRDDGPGPDGEPKAPPRTPVLVVAVDNEIISGHNDIYRPVFIDFLRYFIVLSQETAAAPGAGGGAEGAEG